MVSPVGSHLNTQRINNGRARVGVRLFALVLVVAGGVSSFGSLNTVEAAVIDSPVTNITVTPPNPRVVDPVRTDVQWCVPDSASAGDTFQIALPPELLQLPRNFNLRDPDGILVATALIEGVPAVVTFTFNDYVDTHTGVCGTAFFESRLDSSLVPGTAVTLTYVVNGVTTFEPVITPRAGTITIGRGTARKGAFFDDPNDECRTVADSCLGWYIESQVGPFLSITVNDTAPAGTTFACDKLQVQLWSLDASGGLLQVFQPAALGVTVASTCTAGQLQVIASDIPADRILRVLIRATPQEINAAGGVTFSNSASVTHILLNEQTVENNIVARRRSSLVGGDANGVVPVTTTTAPPEATTTTVIVAALPPLPPTTPPTSLVVTELPATGGRSSTSFAALFTLLTGVALVAATRRRRAV
jgi:LPXTG-motif cell wall-anchored protein